MHGWMEREMNRMKETDNRRQSWRGQNSQALVIQEHQIDEQMKSE